MKMNQSQSTDLIDLIGHFLAMEEFLTASGRTPDCIPFADVADAPLNGLTGAQCNHALLCKACLHSLVLSFEENSPSEVRAWLLMHSAAAVPYESPLAGTARAPSEVASVGEAQPSNGFNAAGHLSTSALSFWERLRVSFRLQTFVLAAATCLVTVAMLGAVWLGLDNRRLRTELARSEAQRNGLAKRLQAGSKTSRTSSAESGSRTAAAVRAYVKRMTAPPLAFVLSPGVTRGETGGQKRLLIPAAGVDRVRLNLDFTPAGLYTTYRVIVSSVDGGEVSSRDIPARLGRGTGLAIDLSEASLPEGDYIILVKGRLGTAGYEDLESYYFSVVRGSYAR